MADLAVEVAEAIASGAAGRLAAGGVEAAQRLVSALRARLRADAGARGTLEIAVEDPGDAAALSSLEALLRERIGSDAGFADWLRELWAENAPDIGTDGSRPVNIISGTVHGTAIQAANIHGGVHIGPGHRAGTSGDAG